MPIRIIQIYKDEARTCNRELRSKGYHACSIASGFIDTDMARESVSSYGEEYLTRGSAFEHITQSGKIASLVVFLAAAEIKHMSGSTFHINGGSYMI